MIHILGDPEVTANIYCKLRNLPNTDTSKNDITFHKQNINGNHAVTPWYENVQNLERKK